MSKKLTIVGDNYISKNLYHDVKRYGKCIPNIIKDISFLREKVDYIIDTTFNSRLQKLSISYTKSNNIDKLIILNHWKISDLDEPNITQLIVYDIISDEHFSFEREGVGNQDEDKIQYCNFIAEALRRTHEHKIGGIPNLYLYYGEKELRYSNLYNLYKPILSLLTKNESVVSYYDGIRTIEQISSIIKDIVEYDGYISITNNREHFTHKHKRIELNTRDGLHYNLRKIYLYLKSNNPRFFI